MLKSSLYEDNESAALAYDVDFPECIVVIAKSGRMLTEAAAKTGLKPLCIDLYADSDTRCSAADVKKIQVLDPEHIAPALDCFIQRYSVKHAVYGSGFENDPPALNYLNNRMILLGNSPDTLSRMQNKAEFFSVLSKLNIAYPEVSFNAPRDSVHWLIKPMQGQGGEGIRWYNPHDCTESSIYWQRFQPGTSHSVLFLADGQQAKIIGFNTQWTVSLSVGQEFIFSGIMNHCDLSAAHQSLVTDWTGRCVQFFGLKGLNSLDFIRTGDQCLVLEINPRPPASMQLYDDLLSRHILAAQGVLAENPPDRIGCTGIQIVYAEHDLMIPLRFDWPEGCMDRPESGAVCRKGQPVCSIIAHQHSSQQVLDQLNRMQKQILYKMIKV